MRAVISKIAVREPKKLSVITLFMMACTVLALPIAAQQQGPLPAPPPGAVAPSTPPVESANTNSSRQLTSSHITTNDPAMPVEQIVQKFTDHEDEFRKEPDTITYTQM